MGVVAVDFFFVVVVDVFVGGDVVAEGMKSTSDQFFLSVPTHRSLYIVVNGGFHSSH